MIALARSEQVDSSDAAVVANPSTSRSSVVVTNHDKSL
jgi:hypothetical protein